MAGDPARPRRRAVAGDGAEACSQVPAHRRDQGPAAGQPLTGRFKYAYNPFSYYGEAIERSIERVAEFGYDAIELVGEPERYDGTRIRKVAADAGLGIDVRDEVLPLTPTPAYFPPFWLDLDRALTYA